MDRPATTQDKELASELTVSDVVVNFQGLRALQRVSLRLARTEILGLIGPNGAGKTTLVNVLTGFQEVDAGEVRLDGEDIRAWKPHERSRRGLVRTFQSVLPFGGLTALENVEAGALATGVSRQEARKAAHEVLAWFGLQSKFDQRVDTLPFGEERQVGIARAIAMKPRFLLMDEPAAGLNDAESEELTKVIRRIRDDVACGVLLIEHRMPLVFRLCDRIQVLQQGATIAIGSPEEIRSNQIVRHAYLGDEAI